MGNYVVCFRLETLPDLALSKYKQFAQNGVAGVVDRQGAFLRQWNRILIANQLSMHLLYSYHPDAPKGSRMEINLMWMSERKEPLEIVRQILPSMAIGDFYQFTETDPKQVLKSAQFQAGATLIKRERNVSVTRTDATYLTDFYTVPPWKINEDARLIDMMKTLCTLGEATKKPCALRVDLYGADCSEQMRESFRQPLQKLYTMRSSASVTPVHDVDVATKQDDAVNQILREYEDWQRALDTERHFRMNVYAFASQDVYAEMILSSICAEGVREGDCDILPIKVSDPFALRERLNRSEAMNYSRRRNSVPMCDTQRWPGLDIWSTLYTWKEASIFFRLPALYEGESIGKRKESAPVLEKNGLLIGHDQEHYEVRYPLANLCKHTLICGVPGAGKTNTMLHLITSLWKEKRIPFLVFEPAKKEYRAMFNDPDIGPVMLFSPKIGTDFPLMVNPLEFPRGMNLSEHISMLKSVFEGTFEMQGAVRFFLSQALEKAYLNKGWQIGTVNDGSLPYPTLRDVYNLLQAEINTSTYDKELKGNFQAFLQVRLGSLLVREAGMLFDVSNSTLRPEEWLQTPAIIEMESLGDQEKNFLILVMCTAIMESLRVDPHRDRNTLPDLRHVIFIEEAHNLIADVTEQTSQENINPKISATAFLVKMLAEVRALREGIVITDQLPSVLAPEVIKNTSLKVVHRMTAEDDRKQVCATMSATGVQMNELPVYGVGDALIFYERLLKPFKGRICMWDYAGADGMKSADARYVPMEPARLAEFLAKRPDYQRRVLAPARGEMAYKEFLALYKPFEEETRDLPRYVDADKGKVEKLEAAIAGGAGPESVRVDIEFAQMDIEQHMDICKQGLERCSKAQTLLKMISASQREALRDACRTMQDRYTIITRRTAILEDLVRRVESLKNRL